MNKLITVLIVLIFAIVGCEKETIYAPPTINFITGDGFVYSDTVMELGEVFKIGIEADNPNVNLTNFIIRVESDVIETYMDSGMNTPNLHFERYITKGIKTSEKWSFIIRDRNGKSSEVSFVVEKDTASAYGEIVYMPDIDIGAQNNLTPGFFSLSEGLTYTLSEAFMNQQLIDFCYYYDFIDTDENTIASPGANIDETVFPGDEGLLNWVTRRTTRYKLADITEEDFDNANNDSLLIAVHGQSEGNRKAKNLKTDNIFAFKNEDGKIGLFRVNSIFGTDDGKVNISIKVQK